MQCAALGEGPEVDSDEPNAIDQIDHDFLASLSSPDVKMTVFGLFDEKSCIQAIGILLIDFTSLAPAAISATISLEVRPFKAAIDLFTP